MLHGNLAAAWHYNAFLTVLLPLTLVWSVVVWFRAARSNQLPDFSVPRPAWIVMALIAILFTMARNTGLAFVI
jgi:hypothetical protein